MVRDVGGERAALHGRLSPRSRRGRPRRSRSRRAASPCSRRCSTSERVSTPVSATTPFWASHARPLRPPRLAHDDAAHVDAVRLAAVVGDAVVADHRRREAEDLLGVARVGDELLVAGHRGREDGLAEGDALGAHRPAGEDLAVLEDERAGHASCTTRPAAIVSLTLPLSVCPSSQELAECERKPSSVTRQAASVSSRTRFAGAPTSMRGGSIPNARAGPADMRSSNVVEA